MINKRAYKDDFTSEIIRGQVYAHNLANANTAELHHACATIQAISELLIKRCILQCEDVESRKREAVAELREWYLTQSMATAIQEFEDNKYLFKHTNKVDCSSRINICKAICCKLPLTLPREDIQEGIVCWELVQSYMIAYAADGCCVHSDRDTGGCTLYKQRPIPCCGYDCREDKRIWLDFWE